MNCPHLTNVWDAIEFVAGAAAFAVVAWVFFKYTS